MEKQRVSKIIYRKKRAQIKNKNKRKIEKKKKIELETI
jgi:hypothetical protein